MNRLARSASHVAGAVRPNGVTSPMPVMYGVEYCRGLYAGHRRRVASLIHRKATTYLLNETIDNFTDLRREVYGAMCTGISMFCNRRGAGEGNAIHGNRMCRFGECMRVAECSSTVRAGDS